VAKNIATHKSSIKSPLHLSTAYLHKNLIDGNYLALHPGDEEVLLVMSKTQISDVIAQHNLNASTPEMCVLVGQAINMEVLQKIILNYFSAAQYVVISGHYLHGEFAQQAVELTLYHQKMPTDDSNKTGVETLALITPDRLIHLAKEFFVDAFKVSTLSLSKPGLIVMDMDSTIINMECIDEIASLAGVGEKVSALTERAMQGELDFNQSLHARVSCLQGIDIAELEKLKSRLPINPGFAQTIKILQEHGWITCIASGGFTYFANYLKDTFEITHAISNTLSINQGKLVGKVEGNIVNGEMKMQILLVKLSHQTIDPQQSIAIGDGANDLLMMAAAGLGVAYKAKAKVQAAADANIHYCGFEGLLYCLQA
jgi:phosphoserine phosphatase SerB